MIGTFAAVAALGRVEPDPARAAAPLAALEAGDLTVEQLASALEVSKVTRLALAALDGARLGPRGRALRDRLRAREDADDAWRAAAFDPMRDALRLGAEHGARTMKGLAVQPLYPHPELRHVGDVDLQFPAWSAAAPAVRALRDRGWTWDRGELPWLKWDEAGVLYGQLSLLFPDADDPVARVDVHVGPFSVGHTATMPLTGWRPGTALGVPIEVPDAECAAALTATHALGDRVLAMKDVNDLHVVAGERPIDWSSVVGTCRVVHAEGALAQCVAAVRGVYGRDALPSLPFRRALRHDPPGPVRRAAWFAAHAYRDCRARGDDPIAAARVAGSAYRYFSADLDVRAGDGDAARPLPALRRRDQCWRLVPASAWPVDAPPRAGDVRTESLGRDLELVDDGRASVVVLGDDVLVPTVWGDVSPAAVGLARALQREAG